MKMKTELDKKVYSLCEAVADLSGLLALAKVWPANSADKNSLCIAWAVDFEERHQNTEWGTGGDSEYPEAIDAWFDACYEAWVAATPKRETTAGAVAHFAS